MAGLHLLQVAAFRDAVEAVGGRFPGGFGRRDVFAQDAQAAGRQLAGKGVEVEFVSCLSHCEQGFAVALEDEVLVLQSAEDFAAFLERVERVASVG